MDTSQLVTDVCSCGRQHQLTIARIQLASGILSGIDQKLAALGAWRNILLVADENTWPLAGITVEKALRGSYSLRRVILPGEGLRPTEERVEEILHSGTTAPDLVLAIGSGTITDLVRFVAANRWEIPFISIPTAPSMDGYASTVSAMNFRGFKVTKAARPPLAIFGDLAVLQTAPARLVAAGAADLLGKYTALADWLLARELEDEYYCPYIADLVQRATDSCLLAFKAGAEERVARLTEGLIISGIGILFAGNSRPASGSEHHLSHFWELKEQLEGRGEHLHGEKVAVGSVLSAKAYQFFLEQDPGALRFEPAWRTGGLGWKGYREELGRIYGPLLWELPIMQGEPPKCDQPDEEYSRSLDSARSSIMGSCLEPGEIEANLRLVGAPVSYRDLELPQEWVREALLYGREVRGRYTIFTLLAQLGLAKKALEKILH